MFLQKKKKDTKHTEEKSLNTMANLGVCLVVFIFGIILILFSNHIQSTEMKTWSTLSNTIGSLLVSTACGSLLLEWFGYINYTKKRMCEILSENEVLKVLSKQRKRELKTAILNDLYMPNKDLGENNIVSVIDDEMDDILKDYYYNEFIMYIDISIVKRDGKSYIKKSIRKTYEAETINNNKCSLRQVLSTQINKVDGINPIEVKELIINQEKIEDIKIKSSSNIEDQRNHYDKIFYIDTSKFKDKLEFDDKIFVDLKYETYADITDIVYSHQINRPCKHYCVHFNYSKGIDVDIVGFGFMSNDNREKTRVVETKNGRMLRFMNWILPGDGVMAALKLSDKHK
ncbi:MAG: hypothetical protein ACI4GW_07520 [Lachnospiraceae bacterium]